MIASQWFPSLLALLAIGVADVQAPAAGRAAAAQSVQDVFPRPSRALSIPAPTEDGPRLVWLVEQLSAIGGVNLQASAESRTILERVDIGLFGPVEVPPAEVWSFAESILWAHSFALNDLRQAEPRLVQVVSLNTNEGAALRLGALMVPLARVPDFARHPALLVSTVVPMPHTDVRTLANSMRSMLTDANTQQIIPLGASNALLVTANGTMLASLVEIFQVIEGSNASAPRQAPPADETGSGGR